MKHNLVRSIIHNARVTSCNRDIFNSIAICPKILSESGILQFELINMFNRYSGETFNTMVLVGKENQFIINGPFADKFKPFDIVDILVMSEISKNEFGSFDQTRIQVDIFNNIEQIEVQKLIDFL